MSVHSHCSSPLLSSLPFLTCHCAEHARKKIGTSIKSIAARRKNQRTFRVLPKTPFGPSPISQTTSGPPSPDGTAISLFPLLVFGPPTLRARTPRPSSGKSPSSRATRMQITFSSTTWTARSALCFTICGPRCRSGFFAQTSCSALNRKALRPSQSI